MRKIKTLLFCSTLAALLAACAVPPAPPPKAADAVAPATPATGETTGTLAGTEWVLSTLNGNPPVAGTEITLAFGADGTVSGTDGCNRFSGAYTESDTSLTFGPLASTMMACEESISNQAKMFTDALAVTQSFSTADDTLSLIHTGNAAIATFAPASAAAEPTTAPAAGETTGTLAGTEWVLSTLNGNPPVAGTEITLAFSDDGRVSGTDGCNRFMGSYTETVDSLTFGPLASTMMACPEEISNQAKTFSDALAVTQSFSTADDTLSLIHTGNAAIATFAPASAATDAPAGTLAGTQWVLGSIGGNTPLTGTQITLNFGDDGRVSGTDGCNRFTGEYTEDGESLSFGPLATTMMACEETVTAQATIFGVALQNTGSFTMTDSELALIGRGATLATLTRLSTELAGTQWTVTNYNNGKEAVVGVIEGTTLTLEFGDDGSVSGNAGCNNFFGAFTQGNGTISIGPLGSTMMLCTEPAGAMDQETQYLAALQSAATYQLDGDMLTLRTQDDAMAVVMRREP